MTTSKKSHTVNNTAQSTPNKPSSDAKKSTSKVKTFRKQKAKHKLITALKHSSKKNDTMNNNATSTQTTLKKIKKMNSSRKNVYKKNSP